VSAQPAGRKDAAVDHVGNMVDPQYSLVAKIAKDYVL
jgi:hypothetical protein